MTRKEVEGQKTSPHDDNLIWQIAVWFLTSFCKKICTALLLKGTDVHCTTVSRHFVYDFNLKVFKPAKKPCLASAIKMNKLAFVKQYDD